MKRLYPIRFSRNYWTIPIVTEHICDPNICSKNLQLNTETRELEEVLNKDYKNGRCKNGNLLYPTFVPLSTFNYTNPHGSLGPLYKPDQIVIKDPIFDISIDFPLRNPTRVKINTGGSETTLRDLLFYITDAYKKIYNEEEETASLKEFVFKRDCDCNTMDSIEKIIPPHSKQGVCSICYDDFENNPLAVLKCGHKFIYNCISSWVNSDKTSCPLCRENVLNCDKCNGTKMIDYIQSYKVIPTYLRDDVFRNETDGKYGIYQYDIDHLVIEYLMYNNNTKTLLLQMNVFI